MRRRAVLRGLGAGALGAVGLSACTTRFGRGRTAPTTAESRQPLTEPDAPLILGSVGASHGRSAPFERAIAVAVGQALIDLDATFEGLFGRSVTMQDRIVVEDPGTDLAEDIDALADAGVSAVISSLDEDALAEAMPLFAAAGIAVLDVFTSGMSVRGSEVDTGNMLVRLAPNDAVIAQLYADTALQTTTDEHVTPGTVAYVSEETAQGHSLLDELARILPPAGGEVVLQEFYPIGELGSTDDLVATLLEKPPALLVLNGGGEAGTLLSALHTASLDEDDRPTVRIPARLGPAASIDYAQDDLAAECLENATGYEPGGDLSDDHLNMMLNADPGLQQTGYAYSQQAYDAVMLAALAAQEALSVDGAAIAGSMERVLAGSTPCTDYGACRDILHTAVAGGSTESIAFQGRMGELELGPDHDVSSAQIREVTWTAANQKQVGSATSVSLPD